MPPVPSALWNIEWLNENANRRYPVSEAATLQDVSGTFTIPNDFIVDMIWPIHSDPSIDPTLFHIASIGIFGQGVTVSIGYNGTIIANMSVNASSFERNTTYALQGIGNFFDTVGSIIIGNLDNIMKSAGSYVFDVNGARLVPAVIRPDVRGVSALYILNGEDQSGPIQGDVVFQAGTNFNLAYVAGPLGEPDRIVLNAISGSGLNETCSCKEGAALPCINTINQIPPDENGNFTLLGDDCLALHGIAAGIQLTDSCSKPCCDCTELNITLQAAQYLASEVFKMETMISELTASMAVLQTNLLASKTGTTS